MNNYKNDFLNCLKEIDYAKRNYQIFQDFLSIATISFRNVILKNEELEKDYFSLIAKYKKPEKFAELLAIITMALERKMHDFLGEVFMQANFGSECHGQFFTPYHISKFMSEITLCADTMDLEISENGFLTICEPACGAGGMIIACAESLLEKGYNPQQNLWFEGTDIDKDCCKMTYIQTSLLGLSGRITHGNTLTLENWECFLTPFTAFPIWNDRFNKNETKDKTEIKAQQLKLL